MRALLDMLGIKFKNLSLITVQLQIGNTTVLIALILALKDLGSIEANDKKQYMTGSC